MSNIKVLTGPVIDQIKAGEVIERPASVLKELMENSLDAGADDINVEIRKGGKKLIRVRDNGTGIMSEDVPIAFLRHSTSKISSMDDIFDIKSYGFRGEALASIAVCSNCRLSTRFVSQELGTCIVYDFGKLVSQQVIPYNKGTSIEIMDIFQKIKPRRKFLKSDYREKTLIYNMFNNLAIPNFKVSMRLISDDNEAFFYNKTDSIIRRIVDIMNMEEKDLIWGEYLQDGCKLLIFLPKESKAGFKNIGNHIFINGRFVKVPVIMHIMKELTASAYTRDQAPFYILLLYMDPGAIDVNSHPQKLEVRLEDPGRIIPFIRHSFLSLFKRHHISLLDIFSKDDGKKDSNNEHIKEENEILPFEGIETGPCEVKEQAIIYENRLRVIGQLFKTYLLVEAGDSLLLVDQHALYEEYRFEHLMKNYKSGETKGYGLIRPVVADIGRENVDTVHHYSRLFQELGFDVSIFSNSSVLIRKIPYILYNGNIKLILNEIINALKNTGDISYEKLISGVIASMACHSSLRANYELTPEHQALLLKLFDEIEKPKCPHNRPVFIKMSKREIESLFRRKV